MAAKREAPSSMASMSGGGAGNTSGEFTSLLFEDNFGPNLAHKLEIIKDQVESGQYTLKRIAFFLKKICTLIKVTSGEGVKATEHEISKKGRIEHDAMQDHVASYQGMLSVVNAQLQGQLQWAGTVQTLIIERLTTLHDDADIRRKKLIQQEEKYIVQMRKLKENVARERAACIVLWRELQEAEREKSQADAECVAKAGNPKELPKSQKKKKSKDEELLKRREKAQRAFFKFEAYIVGANEEQRIYYTRDLPALCRSFEMLELERMEELHKVMETFVKLHSDLTSPLPGLTQQMKTVVGTIDTKRSLKAFTAKHVEAHGRPPSIEPFTDGLPCSSQTIEEYTQERLAALLNSDVTTLITAREQGQPTATISRGTGGAAPPPSPMSTVKGFPGGERKTIPTATAAISEEEKAEAADDAAAAADPPIYIVRALYDFASEDENDLRFDPGDLLLITSPDVKVSEIGEDIEGEPSWLLGALLDSNHLDNTVQGCFPSNYVELAPVEAGTVLRHFIEFPSGLRRFSAFLKSEFSQENIEFWGAVQDFRKTSDEKQLADKAVVIMNKYISETAESQVNINGTQKQAIQKEMKAGTVTRKLFDKAQKEIFELLSRDSFARFRKTAAFARYLGYWVRTHGKRYTRPGHAGPTAPAAPAAGAGAGAGAGATPGAGAGAPAPSPSPTGGAGAGRATVSVSPR